MDKIKETDKIKRLVKLSELSKSIVAKIQAMPEVNELKFDLDIILYVCELIENNIKQTETKSIDKKNIVIGILQKCYPFTPPELLILNKMIEFLHSNHLIKQVTKIEKTENKVLNWMIKKIAWNDINFGLDFFDLNIYKKAKIEIITDILLKIYIKKHIIILIIAFI